VQSEHVLCRNVFLPYETKNFLLVFNHLALGFRHRLAFFADMRAMPVAAKALVGLADTANFARVGHGSLRDN
jgi:hypothetical protein